MGPKETCALVLHILSNDYVQNYCLHPGYKLPSILGETLSWPYYHIANTTLCHLGLAIQLLNDSRAMFGVHYVY